MFTAAQAAQKISVANVITLLHRILKEMAGERIWL